MKSLQAALSTSLVAACVAILAAEAPAQDQSKLNFRDDFTGTSLRPEWMVFAPDPDRMTLAENDYVMIITSPAGGNTFVYQGELPDDYETSVKLKVDLLTGNYKYNDFNVVYFGISRDRDNGVGLWAQGNGEIVLRKELKGELSTIPHYVNIPGDVYLKIVKRGAEFEGAYSFDGSQWTSIGKQFFINLDGKPGFGGFNHGSVADTGIRVDYFEIVAR